MVKSSKFVYRYFFVLLILACFQNFSIISLAGIALKPVHIWAATMVPAFLKSNTKINRTLLFFLLIMICCSICSAIIFQINGLIINYIFGIYLVSIIGMKNNAINKNEWIKLVCDASFVMILIIIIKDIAEYQRFIDFFNNPWNGHPAITTIYGGGVNLEASWTCLFVFFYKNDYRKWLYLVLCFVICLLYSSRSGLLICLLALCVFLFPLLKKANYMIGSLIGIIVVAFFLYKKGIMDVTISRFLDTGNDKGSLGRIKMWKYAFETFSHYPMGCGIGNSISAIEKVAGIDIGDNNMHNLYLQNYVELGFIGGTYYIIAIANLFKKNIKQLFNNEFLLYLLAYCILSLIQFRGGDTLVFIILGMFLATNTRERLSIDE